MYKKCIVLVTVTAGGISYHLVKTGCAQSVNNHNNNEFGVCRKSRFDFRLCHTVTITTVGYNTILPIGMISAGTRTTTHTFDLSNLKRDAVITLYMFIDVDDHSERLPIPRGPSLQ